MGSETKVITENNFYFVSPEVEFEETVKGAKLIATVMELEKISKNGRLYRIEEAESIAKSLIGKDVYYGVDTWGRHCNPLLRKEGSCSKAEPVGIVESAKVLGNKIKAVINIIDEGIIQALRGGVKYLFSVGGNAVSETIKKIGNKLIHVLKGAKCNHLQMLDSGTPIGFPNAKMEKLIEINETVMVVTYINVEETWITKSDSIIEAIEFEE